jgi:uncharacterized protein (TIGR02996 family)
VNPLKPGSLFQSKMVSSLTSPDYVALLRAVIFDPFDELPRLVLADWLEERNYFALAKRIRQHVENGTHESNDPLRGSVATTLSDFLRNAIDLFSQKIVITVRISDVEPLVTRTSRKHRGIRWLTQAQLPPELFNRLPVDPRPFYEMRLLGGEAAWGTRGGRPIVIAALSDACVSFGRERAGLPPLRKE